MRPPTFKPRRGRGDDGAALAAAAICGLVVCLLAFASAVEAFTPLLHSRPQISATR